MPLDGSWSNFSGGPFLPGPINWWASCIILHLAYFKISSINKILILLVGFSAGALLGGAFLHLLPEVIEEHPDLNAFAYVLIGFII